MTTRIIVTSPTPPEDAIPLGGDVYEVPLKPARAETEKGEVIDVLAAPLPTGATVLDKVADRAAAIRPRWDLPANHWLRGLPARAAGLAGDCDELMGVDGEWHPVRDVRDVEALIDARLVARSEEPKPVEPGDEKPIEEVVRGR